MKRKRQPADRLSALPDDMLECILSHLPSDEAVRTSLLSRRWRDAYETVPVVDLVDHKKGSRGSNCSMDDVKVCFDQKMTGAILGKAPGTAIRTLRLVASYRTQKLIDQWIASAVSSGVEEIDVKLRYRQSSGHSLCPFTLAQDASGDFVNRYLKEVYVKTQQQLFVCSTLRRLRLTNWKLDLPLRVAMASLETLYLGKIMDPNGQLQHLLANCPRLADLTLQECPSLTEITVASAHLRSFAMICCHQAQQVKLHSQCLKSLHYRGGIPDKSLFELADHSGIVALTVEICEVIPGKEPTEVAAVTTLMSQCTNLTYLHLSVRPFMAYISLFIDGVRCLSRLRQLGLQGCLSDDDGIRSVAVFLRDTPNLEVLSIFPPVPRAPKKMGYFSDTESDDELEDELEDGDVELTNSFWRVTKSFWSEHIRCLDDNLRRINIGGYKGLRLQKILAKFLLSRSASLEEFSVTLAAGCSRRNHVRELRSWRSNPHTRVAATRCQ